MSIKVRTKEINNKRKEKYEYEIKSVFPPTLSEEEIKKAICKKIARIIINNEQKGCTL